VVYVPVNDPLAPGQRDVVVIGVGNEFRRDDGAGPAVAGRRNQERCIVSW
jgi:hypothetical protein